MWPGEGPMGGKLVACGDGVWLINAIMNKYYFKSKINSKFFK